MCEKCVHISCTSSARAAAFGLALKHHYDRVFLPCTRHFSWSIVRLASWQGPLGWSGESGLDEFAVLDLLWVYFDFSEALLLHEQLLESATLLKLLRVYCLHHVGPSESTVVIIQ